MIALEGAPRWAAIIPVGEPLVCAAGHAHPPTIRAGAGFLGFVGCPHGLDLTTARPLRPPAPGGPCGRWTYYCGVDTSDRGSVGVLVAADVAGGDVDELFTLRFPRDVLHGLGLRPALERLARQAPYEPLDFWDVRARIADQVAVARAHRATPTDVARRRGPA